MRKIRWAAVVFAAAGWLVAALPAQASTGLVQDGSFEAQNGSNKGPCQSVGGSFAGSTWFLEQTTTAVAPMYQRAEVYYSTEYPGITTGDGSWSMELGCFNYNAGPGLPPAVAAVSQYVATTPGQVYVLHYKVGAAKGTGHFLILVDGVQVTRGTIVPNADGSSVWLGVRTKSFTASGSSTKITLSGVVSADEPYGPLFDHIRVTLPKAA